MGWSDISLLVAVLVRSKGVAPADQRSDGSHSDPECLKFNSVKPCYGIWFKFYYCLG